MYSLKKLQPYFGGYNLTTLTRADVRRYIGSRQADDVLESTIRRELRFSSAAINFVRLECVRSDLPNPVIRLTTTPGEAQV
ncbi:hypothetical protein WS62_18500 [Burkholderia sp. ABCPW 14]|uniref:hypothetical protein n=1 Tax=Burkholderia sp. ABCPW 14 TaxID=1637860 RepID=UPI000770C391|nr:hypothetical protein [Burkholderia sp. ABCPW 14]KVD87081.1 hypothetical protein WS62_18500 [Burkholderia sp. ABCPW 14]